MIRESRSIALAFAIVLIVSGLVILRVATEIRQPLNLALGSWLGHELGTIDEASAAQWQGKLDWLAAALMVSGAALTLSTFLAPALTHVGSWYISGGGGAFEIKRAALEHLARYESARARGVARLSSVTVSRHRDGVHIECAATMNTKARRAQCAIELKYQIQNGVQKMIDAPLSEVDLVVERSGTGSRVRFPFLLGRAADTPPAPSR